MCIENLYRDLLRQHSVFNQLKNFKSFYFSISDNASRKFSSGVQPSLQLNSVIFESLMNTIDSMLLLLENGRLGDAYTILRRFEDLTLFQTYIDINLKEKFSIDNLIVGEINNWITKNNKAPEAKKLDKYIKDSKLAKPLCSSFDNNEYTKIRRRCNNYIHFNNLDSIIFQDQESTYNNTKKQINQFKKDSLNLFVRHFALILYLNGEYITDDDYFILMDTGLTEIGDEEPWVSPIIQEIFDKYIKPNYTDIANILTDKLFGDLK